MKKFTVAFLFAGMLTSNAFFASEDNTTENTENNELIEEKTTHSSLEELQNLNDLSNKSDCQEPNLDAVVNHKSLTVNKKILADFITNISHDDLVQIIGEVKGKEAQEEIEAMLFKKYPEYMMQLLLNSNVGLSFENLSLHHSLDAVTQENSELKSTLKNSDEFSFEKMLQHLYNVHPNKTIIVSSVFGVSAISAIVLLLKNVFTRSSAQKEQKQVKHPHDDISYLLQY